MEPQKFEAFPSDTNEEYIIAGNAAKEPSVLKSIFRSIFVETPKDFFPVSLVFLFVTLSTSLKALFFYGGHH